MDATFMNSEKSKTSERYKLLLNFSDKINLTLIRMGFLIVLFSGASI